MGGEYESKIYHIIINYSNFSTGCAFQKYKAYIELSNYDGVSVFERDGKYIRDSSPDEFVAYSAYSEENFERKISGITCETASVTFNQYGYICGILFYNDENFNKFANLKIDINQVYNVIDETINERYSGNIFYAYDEKNEVRFSQYELINETMHLWLSKDGNHLYVVVAVDLYFEGNGGTTEDCKNLFVKIT